MNTVDMFLDFGLRVNYRDHAYIRKQTGEFFTFDAHSKGSDLDDLSDLVTTVIKALETLTQEKMDHVKAAADSIRTRYTYKSDRWYNKLYYFFNSSARQRRDEFLQNLGLLTQTIASKRDQAPQETDNRKRIQEIVTTRLTTFLSKFSKKYGYPTVGPKDQREGEAVIAVALSIFILKKDDFEANMEEMLKGAHFLVPVEYAQSLETALQGYQRTSTHYPEQSFQQHGLDGAFFHHVLSGRMEETAIDGRKRTYFWFQLENTPDPPKWSSFKKIRQWFYHHIFDFAMHHFSGQNVGPYGFSARTDERHDPIRLEPSS